MTGPNARPSAEQILCFVVELGRKPCWHLDGFEVYVNTPDEALMCTLCELGAHARSYPPEAATRPELVAWEVNLAPILYEHDLEGRIEPESLDAMKHAVRGASYAPGSVGTERLHERLAEERERRRLRGEEDHEAPAA